MRALTSAGRPEVGRGEGRLGGYIAKEAMYCDSGGHKVKDKGAIFVAERYMDQGYEAVFRQTHPAQGKTYDLSIKTSDDTSYVKNIEVKRVTSPNPGKIAEHIHHGFRQFGDEPEGTVAVVLSNHRNDKAGLEFAMAGFDEAKRKGWVAGHVEIWFKDKTKIDLS